MKRWMGCKQKHIWTRTNRFKALSITCTLNLKVSIKSNWHHHDVELPIELRQSYAKLVPILLLFVTVLLAPNASSNGFVHRSAITVFPHTQYVCQNRPHLYSSNKIGKLWCSFVWNIIVWMPNRLSAWARYVWHYRRKSMYVCVDVCLCCSFLCVRSQTYMSNNLCVWWIYMNWNVGRFGWL